MKTKAKQPKVIAIKQDDGTFLMCTVAPDGTRQPIGRHVPIEIVEAYERKRRKEAPMGDSCE